MAIEARYSAPGDIPGGHALHMSAASAESAFVGGIGDNSISVFFGIMDGPGGDIELFGNDFICFQRCNYCIFVF